MVYPNAHGVMIVRRAFMRSTAPIAHPYWNGNLSPKRLPCHTAALLYKNRVERMADERVDYNPLSSYVLRNGFLGKG